MLDAGIASKLTEPVFFDEYSCECKEEDARGLPCYHQLDHPEYLFFFDECGTNLKGDKNGRFG